ncbi:hypothetical protein [Pseudomonas soli]|uniref:Uncharacterized protein n=1 Tax=Pseudomonas soli TaxID=1306993 RepID=A0A2V4I2Q5_9PSED|nr:hypothetical protein [Pseudomonas soli]PYB83465.1 hypothetical protein DMX07_09370 [Pseudomonas soli]
MKTLILSASIGLAGCALALFSRQRSVAQLNTLFDWLGRGEASLVEHFLSGLGVVLLSIFLVVLHARMSTRQAWPKAWLRAGWFVALRSKVFRATRPIYIVHWSAVIATVYVLASCQWELGQAQAGRAFQTLQLSMDIAGSATACLFLMLLMRADYRRARQSRSLVLGR